jgi:DNA-binding beta-propeller fold protein YncE
LRPTAKSSWPTGTGRVPTDAQQDGDRLVRIKTDGTFVGRVRQVGQRPRRVHGPHALAYDSQGRLFVADRSNNRVQVFDRNMQFVDEWRQFGRPSGIAILQDDTLVVADSESSQFIGGPPEAPEGGGNKIRIPGGATASASAAPKDGSLRYYQQGRGPKAWARTTTATSSPG